MRTAEEIADIACASFVLVGAGEMTRLRATVTRAITVARDELLAPSPCGQPEHRAFDWVDERKGERRKGKESPFVGTDGGRYFHTGATITVFQDFTMKWEYRNRRVADRRTDDRGGRCIRCEEVADAVGRALNAQEETLRSLAMTNCAAMFAEREARIRREAMEECCNVVCVFCGHTTAKAWRNDKGEWVHYDNGLTECDAAAIRKAMEESCRTKAGNAETFEQENAALRQEIARYHEGAKSMGDALTAAMNGEERLEQENAALKAEIERLTAEKG